MIGLPPVPYTKQSWWILGPKKRQIRGWKNFGIPSYGDDEKEISNETRDLETGQTNAESRAAVRGQHKTREIGQKHKTASLPAFY